LIKNGIRFEEIYIDGFIYTLLNIMGLNNDPYYLYLQYIFKAFFDKYKYKITFRADFAILSQSRKIFLVMESKTMFNITFSNNWKEDQVIGEIFVIAYHSFFHSSSFQPVRFPLKIYAVRVISTQFTFYKSMMDHSYM